MAKRALLITSSRCFNPTIADPHFRSWMRPPRMGGILVGSLILRTRSFSGATIATAVSSPSSPLVSSYIVIGNGPVGASIAKHLVGSLVASNDTSGRSSSEHAVVTLVDGRPMGMGSSHSDRARLIRTFDAEGDVDWTRWNRRSLEAFPNIERLWNNISHNNKTKTRKSFFTKCGALLLGDEEFVARSKKAADASLSASPSSPLPLPSPSFSLLTPTECKRKWPYLKPKPGCDVALFDPSGGIIDPLAFIEAQNHNAMSLCSSAPNKGNFEKESRNNGIRLDVLSDAASKIRNGGTIVELASGKVLIATEKIILCGGAYSRSLLKTSGIESIISPSFPSQPALRVSKRTVALLEVTPDSVEGILRDMPTIKYAFGLLEAAASNNTSCGGEQSRVEAGSVYILPPVFYPGGKWFVKIGGGPNDFFEGTATSERTQLDNWLASEGDPSSAEWLGDIGRSLLSTVSFESMQSMACVTTTTTASNSNGVMMDDVLGDGSLVAISACQGKGAGPSDAIGADIVRSIL